MRDKFKRLFSGRSLVGGTELSGSFNGDALHDSLLGNNNEDDDWDAWSVGGKDKDNDKNSDRGRGRSSSRQGFRRSQSERPTIRKRSKSEVSKRLKRLEGDLNFGEATPKKKFGGSKSVGGVFKGKSSEVRSKIDSLALERSISESNFKSPKTKKKLRGGKRMKSVVDDSTISGSGESAQKSAPTRTGRSRSVSRGRGRKTSTDDIGVADARLRSSSKIKRSSSSKPRKSKSTNDFPDILHDLDEVKNNMSTTSKTKRSSISKRRKSKSTNDFPEILHGLDEDKDSMSTITTKESKKKKKKKSDKDKDKKKRNKSQNDDSSEVSIPSKVEMSLDYESSGSISTQGFSKSKKKKVKDKEKTKKTKRAKSKIDLFQPLPPDDFGDGLEGLAEEFRRSKNGYGDEKLEHAVSKSTSDDGVSDTKNNSYTKVSSMFENAWTGMEQSNGENERSNSFANDDSINPFAEENRSKPFAKDSVEDDILRQAVDYEVKASDNNTQQEKTLELQQKLATALEKQVTMSEEHIQDKNEFLQLSRELERVKVELAESLQERGEVMEDLKDRDQIIEVDRNQIENLEEAIDKQIEKEEELVKNVQQSEEEIVLLLEEIKKFEKKLENGETSGGGASFVELRNAKKALSEREEEVASQKLQIEVLENDLKDSMTVPQLQIEELDQEKKALQGRLMGERLEYTSKLSAKDEIISKIRTELASYTASPDALDIQSARQKLNEAREDATSVREDLAATKKMVEELHGEHEDTIERYSLLKDNSVFMEKSVKELTEKSDNLAKKVLEWTERTYDWKQKAESAERKLKEYNDEKFKAGSDNGDSLASGDVVDKAPQGMFLQAAMEKGKRISGGKKTGAQNRSNSWGIFKNGAENQELSVEEMRIRVLEEQNHDFEANISRLSSDLVKMQTGHKEELYTTKKKIAQLEMENEALALQNSTLAQLQER